MHFESTLVTRICHDLITPLNAINLAIETFEMSRDETLVENLKESVHRTNIILKFIRELFSEKSETYCYSVLFLNKILVDFLGLSNIKFDLRSDIENIPNIAGKIVMYTSVIAKENMPLGGFIYCRIDDVNNEIITKYNGKSVTIPSAIKSGVELNYKNVFRYCLDIILKESEFEFNASQDGEDIIIIEKML